jgi:hypothetical protein
MSSRADKRARRVAREVSETLDRQRRAMRRVPRWRTLALLFGFRGPSRRWLTRWEERNAKASAVAEKKTAHFVRREMRQGPQPLPGHMRRKAHTESEHMSRKAHTEISQEVK